MTSSNSFSSAVMMYGASSRRMISSELPELLNLARRIVVLREGFLTGELSHEEFSQENLLNLMA